MTASQPVDTPEFDVIFNDETVEPEARVIPEGAVRIELWNSGEHSHDFALLRLADLPASEDRAAEATESGVAAVKHLRPGDRATLETRLPSGRYVLVDDCCPRRPARGLLDLTVQPVEG